MSQAPETSHAPVTTAKASLQEVTRRRSERLLITVPIRVEGVDRNGEKFTEETRTIVINREGARIYLKRLVAAGQLSPGHAMPILKPSKPPRRSRHCRRSGSAANT